MRISGGCQRSADTCRPMHSQGQFVCETVSLRLPSRAWSHSLWAGGIDSRCSKLQACSPLASPVED